MTVRRDISVKCQVWVAVSTTAIGMKTKLEGMPYHIPHGGLTK